MRILNIAMNAPFTEGYSYQDNLLPEYQQKLGHSVTLVTGLSSRDEKGNAIKVIPCDKILNNGVRLIRLATGNRINKILGYYPKILNLITEIQPDVIFIHGLCNLIPIQAIKYKNDHPKTILVADNHQDKKNSLYNKFPFNLLFIIWKKGWNRWIKHFNHIYGTTSWRRDFAIELFGIPKAKADPLLLGVDVDNLSTDREYVRNQIRNKLDIPKDAFVFIHGGKMCSNKKTIEIIQAFSNNRDSNIRLILFGSVSDDIEEGFKNLIQLDRRIKYIGFIESKYVHKFYYASDFALFPGLHSVLWEEAIGCGLPGIFQTYSANDHTNICGNSISMSPDADVNDIYDIINNILNSTELYSEMKENALKASRHLSYYEIAKKSIEE